MKNIRRARVGVMMFKNVTMRTLKAILNIYRDEMAEVHELVKYVHGVRKDLGYISEGFNIKYVGGYNYNRWELRARPLGGRSRFFELTVIHPNQVLREIFQQILADTFRVNGFTQIERGFTCQVEIAHGHFNLVT